MYGGYRGRGGPAKGAAASVQCQKCLQRERHYSYECKAGVQERPYVPRPSRTQQLFNPKLLPKLSNEVPPDVAERKKGVADQELAKKEAERAKKRELEREESPLPRDSPSPKRRRSPSYDSVSTVSTHSPSPPRKRISRSPGRVRPQGPPEPSRQAPARRGRSLSPDDDHSSRYSESPERAPRGRSSPRRRSLSRSPSRSYSRSLSPRNEPSPDRGRQASYSSKRGEGLPPHLTRDLSRSRSPVRPRPERDDQKGYQRPATHYQDREDQNQPRGRNPRPPPRRWEPSPPPRERSLSPFSKRLALTQAMNRGGR